MTFVITSPCIDTQDQSCVDACPVDCIHFEEGSDRLLYINPIECIDCGACQPACPVDAIFPDGDVPDAEAKFIEINELWFEDPAAARARVSGDDSAPSAAEAPAAEAPAESTTDGDASESELEQEETDPFRQVAGTEGFRSAASAYHPSPVGFVAVALFSAIFFAMWVFPGPAAITVADVSVGATVFIGVPMGVVFVLIFVVSQWSALSRFAATRPRRTSSWREGDLDWRRGEESRRAELTKIVNQIARDRFAFPNEENPELQTYVNLPEPQMAIQVQGGIEKLLPDIVVLDKPGGRPKLIAQVESTETLTREQAEYVWARLETRDVPLLLYVPSGMASTARDYVKAAGIKNAEIRTWRRLPQGMKVLELN